MIFYFSGTGNSRWVAQQAAAVFGGALVPMGDSERPQAAQPVFELKPDENILFVFPVHSWGVPPLVRRFVQKVQLQGYAGQPVQALLTCGDECGHSNRMLHKLWQAKGWTCGTVAAVQMPNNYIAMPGFDVDDTELAAQKIEAAKQLLPSLLADMAARRPVEHYLIGKCNALKSHVVYPAFCRWALTDNKFMTTDSCNGCGACAKACPVGNIVMTDGRPQWQGHCTQCGACLHICPQRAVQYGQATQKKGRYYFKNN